MLQRACIERTHDVRRAHQQETRKSHIKMRRSAQQHRSLQPPMQEHQPHSLRQASTQKKPINRTQRQSRTSWSQQEQSKLSIPQEPQDLRGSPRAKGPSPNQMWHPAPETRSGVTMPPVNPSLPQQTPQTKQNRIFLFMRVSVLQRQMYDVSTIQGRKPHLDTP